MGQRIAFVRQQLERILHQPIVADHLPQLVEKRAIHEIGGIIVLPSETHVRVAPVNDINRSRANPV
jgi:hypothetical protein